MFNGYYNNQEATRNTIIDGWVKSNDLAVMDSDGYLTIIGHTKNIIIKSGENILAAQIEEVLSVLPGIKYIKLVGVDDEIHGEDICAFIIRNKEFEKFDLSEESEFIQEKLPKEKWPKYAVYMDKFPLTLNGKVQPFKLKEQFSEMSKDENAKKAMEVVYHKK